jgi:hypothetical protein
VQLEDGRRAARLEQEALQHTQMSAASRAVAGTLEASWVSKLSESRTSETDVNSPYPLNLPHEPGHNARQLPRKEGLAEVAQAGLERIEVDHLALVGGERLGDECRRQLEQHARRR